jgi:hypothetical protein
VEESKMANKNFLQKYWWILLFIVLLYGGSKGWFGSITNTFTNTPNPTQTTSSANPVILPPIAEADKELECYQKAAKLNALYYINPVSTAKECLDFAILDCQDVGKVIDGYGIDGTCCYYTCGAIVPQQPGPVICSDNDYDLGYPSYLETLGTCTDSSQTVSDSCDGAMVKEYYCEPGMNDGASTCQYGTYNCPAIIPGSTCVNGKCVVDPAALCAENCDALQGYSTGACFAYNPNGAPSMSSVCVVNNGEYVGATGCSTGNICCCR